MSCHFGLSFGNTNMCLAMHKEPRTEVLANCDGHRVTPSVIVFLDETEDMVVGHNAKQIMHKHPTNTVTNIKSLLFTGAESDKTDTDSKNQVKVNGKIPKNDLEKNGYISSRSIQDFLCILFSNMKEIASSNYHGSDDFPTVVAVPLTFTEKHREILKEALTSSGFQVLRIINEPSAAALAYDIGQDSNDSNSKCLVFRMGGTSLDVTVLQISNGMYSVLSSVQRNNFGGHLVTNCVVDYCATEFQRKYKVDVKESKRSLTRLRAAAERYKHVSHNPNERCQVESIYDGIDLDLSIRPGVFNYLIQNTIYQCLEPVTEALSAASLTESDINTVVLCGGSCKLPKLQEVLSQKFPSAKVLYSINSDEVIAVGAAKEAVLINSDVKEHDCVINLLSRDLSIKLTGFSNAPEELLLCSKGTLIPTVITQSFTVSQNSNLKVELCEGTPESDSKPVLAVLNMPNLPIGDVYFSFHIRSDGSVFVTCKDCSSKELGSATLVPPRGQTSCS